MSVGIFLFGFLVIWMVSMILEIDGIKILIVTVVYFVFGIIFVDNSKEEFKHVQELYSIGSTSNTSGSFFLRYWNY